jgi:predicted CXXCH cytochrome family protein
MFARLRPSPTRWTIYVPIRPRLYALALALQFEDHRKYLTGSNAPCSYARVWYVYLISTILAICVAAGCDSDESEDVLAGSIRDTAGAPVAGATLYAVPADRLAWVPITADDLTEAEMDFDQPLENLVTASGDTFPNTVTDDDGGYSLALPPGRYYLYVVPDPVNDPLHLPGGSESRSSRSADELLAAGTVDIKVSSQPSSFEPSSYIGSTACIGCHGEKASWQKHAHANGIHEPGQAAPLQSAERIEIADAETLAKFAANTTLYFYDYDGSRGDDKFKIQEGGTPPATTEFAYRLFTADGKYQVEFQNIINQDPASDPIHGQTFTVSFLYGGFLFKQRFVSRLDTGTAPATTSSAYFVFPPAQLQPGGTAEGPLAQDRTRWPWRDIKSASFWDTETKRFKVPAAQDTFDAQCSACHFTGFSIDTATLESTAFESPGGIPWKTPERRVEGNLGCEVCHGPGKQHREAASSQPGQFIVQPGYLAAEREMAICGQCHSRPEGNDSLEIHGEPPLDLNNRMMRPGTNRKTWRALYTSRTDGDPAADFWDGGVHSKRNRQQFSDLLKSKKYVNPRMLVTCTDCHDVHGQQTDPVANPRGLVASIEDNSLCTRCHTLDTAGMSPEAQLHALHDLIGTLRPAVGFRCVNCHMSRIGKTGAGRLGQSSGTVQYFENDIADHTFIIPRKGDPGIASYTLADASKGKAMPIPYTGTCSNCHDLATVASTP